MEIDVASLGRAALFLGIPSVLMIFIFQWTWAKTCDNNIQVLTAQMGGGGKFQLAPKEGGQVTIYNPSTDETRTWPINELATIDVLYPGVGFVPKFLQKTIRMAIVNEGDWEPMLNRSPHRTKIASPDVLKFFKELAVENPKLKEEIEGFIAGVSTGATREMIADPSVLGNLMRSSVMKALANVSTELTEALKSVTSQLARLKGLNSTVVYIGLGLTVILLAFMIIKIVPAIEQVTAIAEALGVAVP